MSHTKDNVLMVGAGMADITPAMGIQLGGDPGRRRAANEVKGRCYAKALVVQQGETTVCFFSFDALGIMRPWSDRLRQEAAAILGTVPEAIIAHASQSHSAPSAGNYFLTGEAKDVPEELYWVRGVDAIYFDTFLKGALAAVRDAKASLRPARLKAGRAVDSRISYNRRFIFRDGRASWHPGTCYPGVLKPEGPSDPEVGLALFEDEAGKPIAALLHHTCHPGHGFGGTWVSPDWPGAWGEGVKQFFGEGCIALTLNGACGNIHHANHIDPHQQEGDTIERMTGFLVEATERAIKTLEPIDVDRVTWLSRRVPLNLRPVDPAREAKARAYLKEHPLPQSDERGCLTQEWVGAVGAIDRAENARTRSKYDYEIQLLRIGALTLVGWAGEPFVEAQLDVKLKSPAKYTFVAHFCNDQAHYIGTRLAHRGGGGGEVDNSWTMPGSLELIGRQTRRMLREIYSL